MLDFLTAKKPGNFIKTVGLWHNQQSWTVHGSLDWFTPTIVVDYQEVPGTSIWYHQPDTQIWSLKFKSHSCFAFVAPATTHLLLARRLSHCLVSIFCCTDWSIDHPGLQNQWLQKTERIVLAKSSTGLTLSWTGKKTIAMDNHSLWVTKNRPFI